jgi:hypothetical protein
MDFKPLHKEVGAAQSRKALRQALAQAKDYQQLARAFDVELLTDLKGWQTLLERRWLQP